jgi:hypothetical protein
MAKYITISTLGAAPLKTDERSTYSEIIGMMQKYWCNQLDKVLPDKPNIYVAIPLQIGIPLILLILSLIRKKSFDPLEKSYS